MATEFKLPELGENVEKADLVRVLVSVGDTIAPDQSVVELETEKATMEVPSTVGGKVKEIYVQAGQQVKVGQLILTVENGAGAASEAKASAKQVAEPKPETKPDAKPDAEAATEPRRPVLATAGAGADAVEEEEAPPQPSGRGRVVEFTPPKPPPEPETGGPVVPAAPSVRRFARELGVDISAVSGTGPGGRISVEDVKAYVKGITTGARALPAAGAVALPDFSRWGAIDRQPMRAVRRKTAEHLAQAWASIPTVTQHDKADITQLEELRKQYAKRAEAAGGKLTVTAIALKVVAAALKVFPQFGASLDMARQEIIYKKYCHVGVAVDTDRGLLVPVIRDVDRKNIIELSVELNQAAERARAKKLTPEEMEGGVFTITNLGGIGGTYFSPIVNAPESAILGISRGALEPLYRNGRFEPRLMLPLSLSYDHRLIDGADAARFIRWVAEALEQPFLLSLQG